MSERPAEILLLDILDACTKIETYINDISFENFSQNSMIIDAVERNIEIIGEACNKIPDSYKLLHSEIEWHKPIGMRNRLIHGYFATDIVLLWNTVSFAIPTFKKQVEVIISSNQ